MNRRDFVQLLGLASGASLISSCGLDRETEKLIPYLVPPDDGVIPGKAVYYNTTCTECPAGCGVSAKVMDYKAAKLEGNPAHPINAGALCMRGQASISRLYHPERLSKPLRRGAAGTLKEISWEEAFTIITAAMREGSSTGKTNVFLAGQTTGTLSRLIDDFCNETGVERLPEFEVFSYAAIRDANRIVFGRGEIPIYHMDRADWALTIGADMFETFVSPVSHAAKYGEAKKRKSFKWAHVEPHVSLTGAQATERYAISPGGELYLLAYLLREVSKANVTGERRIAGIVDALPDLSPRGFAEKTGLSVEVLAQLAHDLQSAVNPIVVAGGVSTAQRNGLDVAVLAAVLQWATGMTGRTVSFDATPQFDGVGSIKDLESLSRRMSGGEIGVLFVTRTDPIGVVADTGMASFEKDFARPSLRVGMGDLMSPSLERCDIILPLAHALESWGDGSPRRDIRSIIQPAIEPVNGSKTEGDVLIQIIRRYQGAATAITYQEYLFGRLKNEYGAESVEKMLDDGFVRQHVDNQSVIFDRESVAGHVRGISFADSAVKPVLVVAPSIRFFDGRGRGIKILEEIPDPLTTISYGDWVSVAVETARELGVEDKDEISVGGQGWTLNLPVKVQPGLPRGVMMVQYSPVRGLPLVYDERTGEISAVFENVSVKKTGKKIALPILSGSQSQHGRGVIPDDAPKESKGNGAHGGGHGEGGEHPSFYPKHNHKDYRWGMAIDLDLCIGCSACAAACHIENNVPVVGPKLHLQGREMSWIRIEPFYDDHENVEFQPMMCQHCDNAPCETVCPVYATYHNPEGLNAQVYNRCVGTRYCSNNCPYKVRRFNWFDFRRPTVENPTRNPEVSTRGRGIMEKCTFCVQRIRSARETAKDEKRKIKDGEVVPACAQTCPTNAIAFGNLEDKNSEVSRLSASDRAHRVFDLLGTEPAVFYLQGKGKKDHHG